MIKLKVGMYVRTKNHNGFAGGIGKIEKIEEDKKHKTLWITLDRTLDGISFLIMLSEVDKFDYDIMKLLKYGDYVNGQKVGTIDDNEIITEAETCAGIDGRIIYKEDIKTIVTKEQFEHMEYEVE